METSIQDRVINIVAEQLGLAIYEVLPTSNFVNDLGIDSLDELELLIAIEDEFELEVNNEEAEKFSNVQEVIDYVTANIQS